VSSLGFWKCNAGGVNVAVEVFLSEIFDVVAIRGNARRPEFLLAGSLSEKISYQIFFDHSMTLAIMGMRRVDCRLFLGRTSPLAMESTCEDDGTVTEYD
jgi:hypothetical protein